VEPQRRSSSERAGLLGDGLTGKVMLLFSNKSHGKPLLLSSPRVEAGRLSFLRRAPLTSSPFIACQNSPRGKKSVYPPLSFISSFRRLGDARLLFFRRRTASVFLRWPFLFSRGREDLIARLSFFRKISFHTPRCFFPRAETADARFFPSPLLMMCAFVLAYGLRRA